MVFQEGKIFGGTHHKILFFAIKSALLGHKFPT